MSERSCNKCASGQVNGDRAREIQILSKNLCKNCILKGNFIPSNHGVHVVNPPVHDDRTLVEIQEEPELSYEDATENLFTELGEFLASGGASHSEPKTYDLINRTFRHLTD